MTAALARLAVVAAIAVAPAAARAQPGSVADPGAALAAASAALDRGDYVGAIDRAEPVVAAAEVDRAEAHRILGLAHFHLGALAAAEEHFLAYLRIDLDGRLDPALHPPEVITFFEDVRARHAAELRALRPRPRWYTLLNLVPPGGQIQNRERGKAIAIGVAEATLAATHVITFYTLRSWCDRNDFTCARDGADDPDTARTLRLVNYASGVALIGVYVYGVIDGFRNDGRRRRSRASVSAAPTEGGMVVGAALSF